MKINEAIVIVEGLLAEDPDAHWSIVNDMSKPAATCEMDAYFVAESEEDLANHWPSARVVMTWEGEKEEVKA